MPTPSFDPVAYLLAQLNRINPDALLPLSASNVTITNPAVVNESAAMDAVAPAINTTATLTAITGQGFSDACQIYYQRLTPAAYLTALGHTDALTLPITGVVDWVTFFAAFNQAYGTVFTAVDYPVAAFSVPQNGELTVTLPPTSLLFVGSMTLALIADQGAAVSLSSAIQTTSLPGLVPA